MAWILIPAVVVVAAAVLAERAAVLRNELAATLESATAYRNDIRRARERIEGERVPFARPPGSPLREDRA